MLNKTFITITCLGFMAFESGQNNNQKQKEKNMKITKLILLVLCMTGAWTLLNAQKHNAPAPVAAPTVKPASAPEGYANFPECRMYRTEGNLKEIYEKIGTMTSVAAIYDSDIAKFELKKPQHTQNIGYNMILWDGFFNIKKPGTYTFFVNWFLNNYGYSHACPQGCILSINDKLVMTTGEATLDVELKAGINKVRFCCYGERGLNDYREPSPKIRYKLRNAIGEYRDFKPADIFHKTVEEDW